MFSSAFKSFSSNIAANYDISKQPTATAGAWTIFDAKKKSTAAQASVFVFKRELLDVNSGGFGARVSATSIKKAQDEVFSRLKKEASSLARLRHPSILQLVEPVEDTRTGGLIFATEPVLGSLAGALAQKDRKDASNGRGAVHSGWDKGTEAGSNTTADLELDELEIQKGLLQVAKGLEFMHEQAKLVHGNMNPDAIFINAKSDWKISGLAFAGPPDGAEGSQPLPQIPLSEVLHNDARIPRSVQLNLDYTSPDFVLDSNITFSADIFSLGLTLLACYRHPHTSPIETHGNQATYKKICNSTATVPNPSNNYLCANDLPKELAQTLPRILARRPAQRMTATEFQQSQYFDNILVNTMRFLDALPAKTPAEKSQFMRGLGRVIPQFPPSILAKKVLSALLDEMKDRDLLAVILQNIFQLIKIIPSSKEAVSDKVLPAIKDVFLSKSKSEERETSKEAGLMVILGNIELISKNCTAKQFKDDALPIIHSAMESTTHSLTDAALQTLPVVLPLLDFSTVKHDLFPVVANVFAKTSSLSIKVRGLEALGVLCGVPTSGSSRGPDDLSGGVGTNEADKNVSSLDKFTMQEKVVPLLKGIKTKEPAVMMAALKVFRQVGQAADVDFLAMEVLPILWSFGLGPLLDLTQFKAYMDLIKILSSKIEREHTRRLQVVGSGQNSNSRDMSFATSAKASGARAGDAVGVEEDFEKLVLGNKSDKKNDPFAGALSDGQKLTQNPPSFSWSSSGGAGGFAHRASTPIPALQSQPQPASRSITPDVTMSAFPSLQPSSGSTAWGAKAVPMIPSQRPAQPLAYSNTSMVNPQQTSNVWQSQQSSPAPRGMNSSLTPMLSPPPSTVPMNSWQQPTSNFGAFQNASAPNVGILQAQNTQSQATAQTQKTGLDKYQSLL